VAVAQIRGRIQVAAVRVRLLRWQIFVGGAVIAIAILVVIVQLLGADHNGLDIGNTQKGKEQENLQKIFN